MGASLGERPNDEAPTELSCAVTHRCQAYPSVYGRVRWWVCNSDAVIADLYAQYTRYLDRKVDGAGTRPGVTRDIGEGLLGYAVGGYLYCRRQRWQTLRRLHRDAQALRAVLRGALAERAEEAEVVKRWRPEPVDQAADVGDGILGIHL